MRKTFCKILAIAIMSGCTAHVAAQSVLERHGNGAHLKVNGQPMLILGGELSNSAATCFDDIDRVMPEMKRIGLNTVLVPTQWDLVEPREGEYDFSLIARAIDKARENKLKVVFLWFGAWKNSMSCYAPMWFKEDLKRFPRAITATGKPMEIASAFSKNVLEADRRAFSKLMEYIKEKDKEQSTVIMVQVENEIGMLESARDYSPEATRLYNSEVPEELLSYLESHAKTLHPYTLKKLTDSETLSRESQKTLSEKLKRGGTWSALFGDDIYTEEMFMAYHYAKYVEQLAQSAQGIHDIPLYVNAALNSRGRKPGEYPSAGPLAHLTDMWRCAAPSISMLSPDIYDTGFKGWASQYDLPGNPLFIPESRCCENSGVRAMYTFGEHRAVGFCPFAIDQASPADRASVSGSYAIINQLSSLLLDSEATEKTWGLLFDKTDRERTITDGNLVMTCNHFFTLPWDARAKADTWPEGGGIIIKLAKNDYIVAGNGIVVTFQTATEKAQEERKILGEDGFATTGKDDAAAKENAGKFTGKRIGIGTVDEVSIGTDGQMKYLRRLNGDQTHQGRHVRISCGDNQILHVRLYEY